MRYEGSPVTAPPLSRRRMTLRKVSIVQEIMFKSTDNLRRIIAPVGGEDGVSVSYQCPHCNRFFLEDYFWWVSGRKTTKWWCAICGEMCDWRQPNWLLVVQTGESFEQARSSKRMRHLKACAQNWSMRFNCWRINKRMEYLLQSIVTNLGKGSRSGLTTVCVNSSGWTMIAPWMLERYAEARDF